MSGVYLYDDQRARGFQPFALTRPVAELRAGALLVRERWARVLGVPVAGSITSPHLAGFAESGAAPVLGLTTMPAGSWIVNARFAPSLAAAPKGDVLEADGRIVAARVDRPTNTDVDHGAASLEVFGLQIGRAHV